MIKRTLHFSSPAYLRVQNRQLVIELIESQATHSVPIEDIGVVVFEHPQITISHMALSLLVENNAAVITCNNSYLPIGLMLPLEGNYLQSERFRYQLEASTPLKKQLWQQTVVSKIYNQAQLLKINRQLAEPMLKWSASVKSGDSENLEARAAAFYWQRVFPLQYNFCRDRNGEPPNNFLNYGYAILRACIARSLVAAGLLPTFGLHHHNRYNAYCLADDIMEPYRPFVDWIVSEMIETEVPSDSLETRHKRKLLELLQMDAFIGGKTRPLMIATQTTAFSLTKCYARENRKISYPSLQP
ncbi:MAG: type II CRISPR-associated endonuclease Cas1 [Saprospiraceae bacterium]